jgi:hypothetical protein
MRFTEILQEDVVNFTDRGIPREFAENLLKRFNINNDAEIESIEGKPKSSDVESGDLIINTQQGDDVVAVLKQKVETVDLKVETVYHRITYQDGEFDVEELSKLSDAAKGMTSRSGAEFLRISSKEIRLSNRAERGAKPTGDELEKQKNQADPLAGGAEGIYSYMNDTFMPKMRDKMTGMVDEIYANLRKLGNSKAGDFSGGKNEQQQAIDAATAIEEIAKKGFSEETMAEFLRTFGQYHSGFASIPRNERELEKLLQNEPNARAKWAKIVLASAKNHLSRVKKMVREPVMRGLRGDS